MRQILRRYRILIFFTLAILLGCAFWLFAAFFGANRFTGSPTRTFFVSRGQSFASIVDSLEAKGIIRDRGTFVFVAKMYGGIAKVQVGKYVFASGESNSEIYLTLRSGKGSLLIPVTIREGLVSKTQAGIFAHAIGIDSARYVGLVYDKAFVGSLGVEGPSLEGYLFPESYSFHWGIDEKEVIRRLVTQFQEFYADSLRAKTSELAWNTNELLTFASIVEGEAVLDEERPIISGVYHNRLRKGMRLEADPTIQFILEDGPRRVLYSDLQLDSPYNTYRYKGLPPGPVNNPGKASILSSLYPARHNYLFFVAKGDGGHWFSSNYADHVRHVRLYRRMRAKNRAAALLRAQHERSLSEN